MIYLDQAATSFQKPDTVAAAVYEAIRTAGNASRGAHGAALSADRLICRAREQAAAFFHAPSPEQTAFTANATEALNLVIKGLIGPSDHVITSVLDHNSVLRPLYQMEKLGTSLTVLPADKAGMISYDGLAGAVRENTKAVILTHASNVTGNLLDIGRIGELCRSRGILFILDAAQTAGVFPVDMERHKIDVVCFTGHKGLLGPQGTGGVCAASHVDFRPVKTGGSGFSSEAREHPGRMPSVLEAGTLNAHGIAGLSAAFSYLMEYGIDRIREKEQKLARIFYEGIREIPGVTVYGDFTQADRAPVVSFNIGSWDAGRVCGCLWEDYEIACRSGMHCAYRMHQALGTEKQGTVRLSFSHFNTEEETARAVEAVKELAD